MDGVRRFLALVTKEYLELKRDKSSLLLGIVLPCVLIVIIGSGLSLDVKNVPTAIVLEDTSPTARNAIRFVDGSEYFSPYYVTSRHEAEELMEERAVSAMLIVPSDFSEKRARGEAELQILLNGTEATTAMSAGSYLKAAVLAIVQREAIAAGSGGISIISRVWFNDANTSAWFFIPGLLMIILTIVGILLTSVVMAKEWERGTFESVFVTPVRVWEIILAKIVPYFSIAMIGLVFSLVVGVTLYDLPMRGSLVFTLLASMLFLLVALGIGLCISAVTKNQFLACQVSLLLGFLPSVMLSGFLFDLQSEPMAIQIVSRFLPTTYYLEVLKSLLLGGNYYPLIVRNISILAGYACLFFCIAFKITRKEVA
ncbi:ABC transporter permease [Selenomonas sp. TAMA-11512]|uniref:ABC transporter permease n=1 Tax=Selenomonas sp. TAMA-11512 TaxID=3095337 RepID=UPI0030864CE2|nr:ABC transporter permease [Selenomonas sp. TAMA-11512]